MAYIVPTLIQVANNTVSANLTIDTLSIGNTTVNSIGLFLSSNFTANSSKVTTPELDAATVYVGNSTVNTTIANSGVTIANSTGTSTLSPGLVLTATVNATTVNAATFKVGTAFTANSTLANVVALNVVNGANSNTLGVTSVLSIGTTTTANLSGIFTSTVNASLVNAAGFSSGNSSVFFTANGTLVNANALNVTAQINAASLVLSTSALTTPDLSVNSSIVNYPSGRVNASMLSCGSGFAANTGGFVLMSEASTNNISITSGANVGTALNVGSNATLNTSSLFIGNSTANVFINSSSFSINGKVLAPAIGNLIFVLGDGSSVISTGITGNFIGTFDFGFDILGWTAIGQETGSISIAVYNGAYSGYTGTTTGMTLISASDPITYSSAIKGQDMAPTGWTTSVAANSVLGFNVTSVTSSKLVTISLKIRKTS
jgi:hypothetical protein